MSIPTRLCSADFEKVPWKIPRQIHLGKNSLPPDGSKTNGHSHLEGWIFTSVKKK